MTHADIEVVCRSHDAFRARDLDAFLGAMDEDVELRSLVLELEGPYRGHDGVRSWWENVLAVFPDWSPRVEEVRELRGRVLARVRAEGGGTGSGIALERDFWQLAAVRDGRIASSAFFRTEEEALEAAGDRA